MQINQDIQQEDNDLLIEDGDFVIDESDMQHIEDIIINNVGTYKEFPLVGIGIDRYINASINPQALEREVKIQLQADGYEVKNPKVTLDPNGKLIIKPNAEIK